MLQKNPDDIEAYSEGTCCKEKKGEYIATIKDHAKRNNEHATSMNIIKNNDNNIIDEEYHHKSYNDIRRQSISRGRRRRTSSQ